jgi:Sulfotransferase family
LLVAGAPRTGTTWIAQVLARADGVALINEPDNEWPNTYALKSKMRLGRFPVLAEGDSAPRSYEELWRRSLSGYTQGRYQRALAWKLDRGERTMADLWRAMCDHAAPRLDVRLRLLARLARPPSRPVGGQRVVVKSVHASLALEWLWATFRPTILVVQRHPLNVIASWIELGWGGCALETNPAIRRRFGEEFGLPHLDPGASRLSRVAWEVGLQISALARGAERHREWLAVGHEDLCLDPVAGFRELYGEVGYGWSVGVEEFLQDVDRPGTGWSMHRIAAEQPGGWRRRLSADQIREAWSVLSRFRASWVAGVASDLE